MLHDYLQFVLRHYYQIGKTKVLQKEKEMLHFESLSNIICRSGRLSWGTNRWKNHDTAHTYFSTIYWANQKLCSARNSTRLHWSGVYKIPTGILDYRCEIYSHGTTVCLFRDRFIVVFVITRNVLLLGMTILHISSKIAFSKNNSKPFIIQLKKP